MNNVFQIKRKPRPCSRDGREQFALFPRRDADNKQFVYALGLHNGEAKIGIAADPRTRIGCHWTGFRKQIIWAHLFVPMTLQKARKVERLAIVLAQEFGQRIGNTEMFEGLSKENAIRCVRNAIEMVPDAMPVVDKTPIKVTAKAKRRAARLT